MSLVYDEAVQQLSSFVTEQLLTLPSSQQYSNTIRSSKEGKLVFTTLYVSAFSRVWHQELYFTVYVCTIIM